MDDIPTIYSLRELHDYLKEHPNKRDLYVAYDWDLNIVTENDTLLEPEVTKKLFDYMRQHNIHFSIVTARFYDTVCDDEHRELEDMDINIKYTIHPILEELGLNVDAYKDKSLKKICHKIHNDDGEIVGVLYQGIFFGDKKGEIIKHYLKSSSVNSTHVVFCDDYDPYLANVKMHLPNALVIRREYEHLL